MSSSSRTIPTALVPKAAGVRLHTIDQHDGRLTVHLQAGAASARCRQCDQPASRIHSRYTRTAADLPRAGTMVRLVLAVRKFFCTNARCAHRIFAERLPTVVAPRARTTTRLTKMLRMVAFALGGEAGARLCGRLSMATSPTTLLRLIRSSAPAAAEVPRILGVDDWAKRKGVTYGTILVDLDAHQVIDLLPDRTAETLATWLKQHPGVEIITRDRDRSERYAAGGKAGAPDALHVADRWHLIHNWAEVLERVCKRHHVGLRQVVLHIPLPHRVLAQLVAVRAPYAQGERAGTHPRCSSPAVFHAPGLLVPTVHRRGLVVGRCPSRM